MAFVISSLSKPTVCSAKRNVSVDISILLTTVVSLGSVWESPIHPETHVGWIKVLNNGVKNMLSVWMEVIETVSLLVSVSDLNEVT
jgi:hypothetical protein